MPSNKKQTTRDNSGKHVKQVFGDPRENVSELIHTSVAIQSLPVDLKNKLVGALKGLPEERQIQAVQTLQKEQSAYKTLATANFERGKEALIKLKQLKDLYQQKKRQLVEKYERKAAEQQAQTLLKNN